MNGTERLYNRINLTGIPFTDRGSRLLLFRHQHQFAIRLAERWVKWEAEVGHYRQRPPIVTDFTLLDADDQPITAPEVETTPHAVSITTALGCFTWLFLDPETLLLSLPSTRCGLRFTLYAQQAATDFRGATLRGKRNLAYTTNARLLRHDLTALDADHFQAHLQLDAQAGQALLLNITPRLGFNRSIPDPAAALDAARTRWQEWFNAAPPVLDHLRQQYEYAWWVMRAGLVNTRYFFTREALLPSKVHYVGVWHWDQVFHALAYRHVDLRLAEDQLRIVLDHQRQDGMLPDAIHDEGLVTHLTQPVDADVTKPPIITWAILKMQESQPHPDFLAEVYDPLTRWNAWWMSANRAPDGLCLYQHPFSSGLDDSPLWDAGMPVVSPDLNTYLVLQHDSLASIAETLSETEAADRHRAEANRLLDAMLAHLWDEQAGLFRARRNDQMLPTHTPFGLLPLLTGRLPRPISDRLVATLTDPRQFWTPYPVPTVAADDPAFDPWQMWRGPSWVNVNYLLVEGLKRSGYTQWAAELRRRTLEMVMGQADIYEYYHPLTGERPPKAAPMYGWSAALFIELALDETAHQQQSR
ncbi:MAG: hypothetical protein HXY41_18525 [Chloroflexi bacterium]|nr:hypothetical protein [Chloroflexota bacterium]